MSKYWKAILAALIPIAYTVSELISDATGDGEWTAQDTKAVVLGLVGAVLVYAVKNTAPPGEPADPNTSVADGRGVVRAPGVPPAI